MPCPVGLPKPTRMGAQDAGAGLTGGHRKRQRPGEPTRLPAREPGTGAASQGDGSPAHSVQGSSARNTTVNSPQLSSPSQTVWAPRAGPRQAARGGVSDHPSREGRVQATPQRKNAPTVHGLRQAGKLRPGQEAGRLPKVSRRWEQSQVSRSSLDQKGLPWRRRGRGEPRPGTPSLP